MSDRYSEVPAGSIVYLPQNVKVRDDRGRVRRIKNEYSFVLGKDSGSHNEFITWGGVSGVRNRVKKIDVRIFAPVTAGTATTTHEETP